MRHGLQDSLNRGCCHFLSFVLDINMHFTFGFKNLWHSRNYCHTLTVSVGVEEISLPRKTVSLSGSLTQIRSINPCSSEKHACQILFTEKAVPTIRHRNQIWAKRTALMSENYGHRFDHLFISCEFRNSLQTTTAQSLQTLRQKQTRCSDINNFHRTRQGSAKLTSCLKQLVHNRGWRFSTLMRSCLTL